ncbi:ABC transporter ATP-binding protein [Phytohabitans kaempferiae]|uniref:ABC transporter ATP-binding protein n=1 Tax=Phytohabitans kaempferiae TaxID=1620943 RepID=A0ABV6MA14_9ACTN
MASSNGGARAGITGLARALGLVWSAGRYHLLGYGTLTLLEAAVPVATAWLTKHALDTIVDPAPGTSVLIVAGVGLAVTGVVISVLPHASGYLTAELGRRVGLLAQDRLFAAAERFVGLRRFEDPIFLDRLNLAQQAGGSTPGQVASGAFGIGGSVVTVMGFIGSLLLVSPLLAAAVVIGTVPAVFAEWNLSRQRTAMMWRVSPAQRREFFFQQLLTSVQAAKELRLFGASGHFRQRMLTERRTANKEGRRMDRREMLTQSGLSLLTAAVAGACLLWALFAAARGRLTAGDVTLLIGAVAAVQGGVAMLVNQMMQTHQELTMFDHFLAVVDSEPDLPVREHTAWALPLQWDIEFRDVWFRYSPEHPWTLRGVSFRIHRGQAVGLVGRNGAGKSTLVKLLCRMYDPDQGSIRWDGVDLRDMDPADLRRRVGVVFQDYMEYDLTAAENIALGDLDNPHDRRKIVVAAQKAGIHHKLAALPHGYDTLLTRMFFGATETEVTDPDNGVVLSGGQWQRLALARALLRDERDLLILDEPSSGLDAEAEYEIHQTLRSYRQGRTSLLISHRLGAIRDADVLVVLDQGRVVERGTHAELMTTGGVYAMLFTMQAAAYQAPEPSAAP